MLAEIATLMFLLQPSGLEPAVFRPARREVSNWRVEASAALNLAPLPIVSMLMGIDPKGTSRCVRLNNYWCIKRAGWAGEIAADAEGHVAFSSAQEGALVAAVLLKRYYVDFKRHTATEIVSRWAPAQCGGTVGRAAPRLGARLASRGLGNTLRARFLAHRRGGAPLRRSIVADRPLPQIRVASIATGVAAREIALPSLNLGGGAGLPSPGAFKLPPAGTCSGEVARVGNYARRASNGIAAENADLKLFGPDGLPTENLGKLMLNMSSVEIGPLSTRQGLVENAVAALMRRLTAVKVEEPHF